MKNIIKIGIPSKGRLRKDVLKIFKNKKLQLISERGERDLFGSIKKLPNIKVVYLHAREIIERLSDGSLDLGFSGYDLLKESEINVQKKISINKKYGFGKANLVVAIPDQWIEHHRLAAIESQPQLILALARVSVEEINSLPGCCLRHKAVAQWNSLGVMI